MAYLLTGATYAARSRARLRCLCSCLDARIHVSVHSGEQVTPGNGATYAREQTRQVPANQRLRVPRRGRGRSSVGRGRAGLAYGTTADPVALASPRTDTPCT